MARSPLALGLFAVCCPVAAQEVELDRWIDSLAIPSERAEAQVRLAQIGVPAAAPLVRALATRYATDPVDDAACAAVSRVLIEIGPEAVGVFGDLARELLHPYASYEMRKHGGMVAARLGPFASVEARGDFLDALVVNRRRMRRSFACWHELCSSLELDAVQTSALELREMLESGNPYARATACRALRHRAEEFSARDRGAIVSALRAAVVEEWEPKTMRWTVRGEQMRWQPTRSLVRWLRTEASLALLAFDPEEERGYLGHCQRMFDLDPAVRTRALRQVARSRNAESARWILDAAWQGPKEFTLSCLAAIERIGPIVRFESQRLRAFTEHEDAAVVAVADRILRTALPFDPVVPAPRLEILGSGIDPAARRTLQLERQRLIAWLDSDGERHREELIHDPNHIDEFDPGRTGKWRWDPARILPSAWRPGYWGVSWSKVMPVVVDAAPSRAMGAARQRLLEIPCVLELLPVLRSDPQLVANDLDSFQVNDYGSGPSYNCRLPQGERLDRHIEFCSVLAEREGGHLLFLGDGLVVGWKRADDVVAGWQRRDIYFQAIEGTEDRWDALRRLAGQ